MEAADNNEFFESQWRQAFDGASVTPPPMVWERVESRLASQKEGKYRKAIFFYRWTAAAMTTVAVGLGAVLMLRSPSTVMEAEIAENTGQMPVPTNATDKMQAREMKLENALASTSTLLMKEDSNDNGREEKAAIPIAMDGHRSEQNSEAAALLVNGASAALVEDAFDVAIPPVSGIYESKKLVSALSVLEVDHLYGVARPITGRKKMISDQPLVAGLGIGSGTFNPNYGFRSGGGLFNAVSVDESASLASKNSSDFNEANGMSSSSARGYNESNDQGGSFAFGASIGKRIFRKLLLQTGLQYGRYNSNGSTNVVLKDESNDKRYALIQASLVSDNVQDVFSTSQFSYEGENTKLTNTYEFISIPVKLGVVLLDRRAGVVLNTGISNEFLVGNLIKAKSEDIEQVKTKVGDSSPYRSVYVNGTLGVEVNYAINNRYKIVVEPYFRQALTSLTKNTDGYSSAPRLWGVQAGVRYELR